MAWTAHSSGILAILNTRAGRPSEVFRCALQLLKTELVAAMQQTAAFPAGRWEYTRPKQFRIAGEPLGNLQNRLEWPQIIVGGAVSQSELGVGFGHTGNLSVTCAMPGAMMDPITFFECQDIASIVEAVFLYPEYAGAMHDPNDATRLIWSYVKPVGISLVPQDWPHYSGWTCHLEVSQSPGGNLWPVPAAP